MLSSGISEHDLQFIKKEMRENAGIDLKDFKTPFLTRRITARMMAKGITSGSEYARLLAEDPIEPLTFFNSLSINVTECFRDPDVWDVFRTEIIPQLIKNHKTGEPIRIWSAGCATGQEPYSIAIMLKDAIGSQPIDFEIVATDINNVSLGIAKSGKFETRSLKNIPQNLLPKYVKKIDDDLYQIREDLKKYIDFKFGDILSFKTNSLDLVVCRNVLIYYGREAQELLFKKFYQSLNSNGITILGMDESMIGTKGIELFNAIYPRQRIFQKKSEVTQNG